MVYQFVTLTIELWRRNLDNDRAAEFRMELQQQRYLPPNTVKFWSDGVVPEVCWSERGALDH